MARATIHRRRTEKRLAKEALEQALALFVVSGADSWAERATAELSRIRCSTPTGLTETEQQMAELAATGRTNREIAATLFVSPKTVEARLTLMASSSGSARGRTGRLHGRADRRDDRQADRNGRDPRRDFLGDRRFPRGTPGSYCQRRIDGRPATNGQADRRARRARWTGTRSSRRRVGSPARRLDISAGSSSDTGRLRFHPPARDPVATPSRSAGPAPSRTARAAAQSSTGGADAKPPARERDRPDLDATQARDVARTTTAIGRAAPAPHPSCRSSSCRRGEPDRLTPSAARRAGSSRSQARRAPAAGRSARSSGDRDAVTAPRRGDARPTGRTRASAAPGR